MHLVQCGVQAAPSKPEDLKNVTKTKQSNFVIVINSSGTLSTREILANYFATNF